MVGTTLIRIREHIEALAAADGEFYLVCGRTGERPIPAAGKRFSTRAVARSAAQAAEQYRTALRRYDPQLPYHDLVICQDAGASEAEMKYPPADGRTLRSDDGSAADRPLASDRPQRVEFCHGVAAAVFETLCDAGHDDVETAVMDAYFELAESVADPDDLCLCLLESMATELDERLSAAEQADVLSRAAGRLASADAAEATGAPRETDESSSAGADAPVTATLARLRELGLVGGYSRPPVAGVSNAETRSVVANISDYALSPRDGRLPVLPVALELSRRRLDRPLSALRVTEADDGWRVAFTFSATDRPSGLSCAPIRSDGER